MVSGSDFNLFLQTLFLEAERFKAAFLCKMLLQSWRARGTVGRGTSHVHGTVSPRQPKDLNPIAVSKWSVTRYPLSTYLSPFVFSNRTKVSSIARYTNVSN